MANYNLVGVDVVMTDATWSWTPVVHSNPTITVTIARVTFTAGDCIANINNGGLVIGDATTDPLLYAELESMVTEFIESFEI